MYENVFHSLLSFKDWDRLPSLVHSGRNSEKKTDKWTPLRKIVFLTLHFIIQKKKKNTHTHNNSKNKISRITWKDDIRF